jgi:hypothetical protein
LACHIASKLSRDAMMIFWGDKSELGINIKMKKLQKVLNSDYSSMVDANLACGKHTLYSFLS